MEGAVGAEGGDLGAGEGEGFATDEWVGGFLREEEPDAAGFGSGDDARGAIGFDAEGGAFVDPEAGEARGFLLGGARGA